MPFHRKLPAKALGCGTSLRLHRHINSANLVIRNWEDYTGERAEIVPKKKNQPCNKQKIGNREMKRLMKPLQGLSFFLNSWSFEAQFLVISHPLSTAHGYMSDVSSRGSVAGLVSSFVNPPSTRPLSIFSLHDCTAEKGVPSQQLCREP